MALPLLDLIRMPPGRFSSEVVRALPAKLLQALRSAQDLPEGLHIPIGPEGLGSLSNDGEEEAWSTLRSILPLKPDLGLENGWMQPSAIFCDCFHQGKPSDFIYLFFLLPHFQHLSGNEQKVKVLCNKTTPQNYG